MLDAWNRRDLEAVAPYLHPDFEWVEHDAGLEAVPVLNYPRLEQFAEVLAGRTADPPDRPRLVYTGGLNAERGALTYADLARVMPDAEVHVVGRTPADIVTFLQRPPAERPSVWAPAPDVRGQSS